jgi:hypothetical protein
MTDTRLLIAMVFDKWCFLNQPTAYNEKSITKRKRIALAKADKVLAIIELANNQKGEK